MSGSMKIYYGNGRGKTTAALGKGILAASEGENVVIIQFLKGKNSDEMSFISRLEPEIRLFRFEKSDEGFEGLSKERRADEIANIKNGMHFAKKVLSTGECSVLILDELLGLLENGIISVEDIRQLKDLADETDVIITGINTCDELNEMADEVYCLETIKGRKCAACNEL